jgi:hypothetical protein
VFPNQALNLLLAPPSATPFADARTELETSIFLNHPSNVRVVLPIATPTVFGRSDPAIATLPATVFAGTVSVPPTKVLPETLAIEYANTAV